MKKDLLLKLADIMENCDDSDVKYDQSTWLDFTNLEDYASDYLEVLSGQRTIDNCVWTPVKIKENACGTAACVLGHAALAMPETGLHFVIPKKAARFIKKGHRRDPDLWIALMKGGRTYGDYAAGAKAFDIPIDHAEVLFGSVNSYFTHRFYEGDFTRRNVSDKLREYVASDGQTVYHIYNEE